MSCLHCQKQIPSWRVETDFCSSRCQVTYRHENQLDKRLDPSVNKVQTGAISELLVCADLTRRGYDVFRAVSPSSSCDLVAVRGDRILRIEVKTGSVYQNGTRYYPEPKPDQRHDVLAAVYLAAGDEIVYDPPLEADSTSTAA